MFDTIAMILMAVLAGGALLLGYGRQQRLKGAKDATDQAKEADHEHAEDIRDRVHRDLPSELRKYQDRGYRD